MSLCPSQIPHSVSSNALIITSHDKCMVIGSIVHSITFGEIELLEYGGIVFDGRGIIESVIDLEKNPLSEASRQQYKEIIDHSGKLIIPGFVDAHCHAPQYKFTGTGMDLPLLAWLEKYTFPCEARFSDVDFARFVYEKSIRRHLKYGTTFASYFATIHNEAGKVLVDVINAVGQRAFVGKVSMDRNSPDFYIEDTTDGCDKAEEFVQYVLSLTHSGRSFLREIQLTGTEQFNNVSADSAAPTTKRPRSVSYAEGLTPSTSYTTMAEVSGKSNGVDDRLAQPFAAGTATAVDDLDYSNHSSSSIYPFQGFNKPRTVSMSSNVDSCLDLTALDNSTSGSANRSCSNSSSSSSSSGGLVGQEGAPDTAAADSTAVGATAGATTRKRPLDNELSEDTILTSTSHIVHSVSMAQISSYAPAPDATTTVRPSSTLLNKTHTPLVMPCITPRFVPTCTAEMMQRLGDIATRYGLPVQSHLSESINEIQWVAELHPECSNYADVYRRYGLLHDKAYMAHCCHSDAAERKLLAECGAGVVHCASSNFMLNSGAMDVRRFVSEGIKVALGTDVAGGYSPSMLDAIRQTIVASKCKLFESRRVVTSAAAANANATTMSTESANNSDTTTDSSDESESSPSPVTVEANSTDTSGTTVAAEYETLTYKEAFHLATLGGAEVLGMDKVVGNFMVGKKLDCLVVNVNAADGPIDVFDGETALDHFQKFLFLGDDRNIEQVFVDGRNVL